jgi:nucleoside-diphosphate-sugar epimerase
MKVLLTGGTGYIGSRVLSRLLAAGHDVTALVRSEESAARLDGGTPLVGDLTDDLWLTGLIKEYDALIHTAAGGDGRDDELDFAVIEAAERSFSGSDSRLIITGGIWTYGSSSNITEDDEEKPPALTAWRLPGQDAVLAGDYHGNIIKPGIVYGYGTGLPTMLEPDLVGDGRQHWTTVHVDDLADLYVLVLEKAPEHEVYLAASGDNPTVRELAEARFGDVRTSSPEDTRQRYGVLSEAFLLDQQADAAKAKALGWNPSRPTLLELFASGYPTDR